MAKKAYLKGISQLCLDGSESHIRTQQAGSLIRLSRVPYLSTPESLNTLTISTDKVKILPRYTVAYTQFERKPKTINLKGLSLKEKLQGTLSRKAITRMTNAMDFMVMISPFKKVYSIKEQKTFYFRIAFITLTLSSPQRHTDNWIKAHMLSPFLKWMERSHNVYSYIWKAETQKNGNIHFHIAINKFIHHKAIRKKWNSLQQQHGYTSPGNWQDPISDPPSTEIKAVKKLTAVTNYMLKYFTKNEKDKRPVQGRIWGASYNLLDNAIIFERFDEEYDLLRPTLQNPDACESIPLEWSTIYVHRERFKELLHPQVQAAIKAKIEAARKKDNGIKQYEIQSLFN
jgi:hypothetical protein